jgi:phosphatidylinositol alpha 1,6-mannosyltransferase
MKATTPRVAFFACAYNEIDGLAINSRQLDEYARRRGVPFLSVHGGYENYLRARGNVSTVEFKRGWPSFPVDKNHDFDLYFWRHYRAAKDLVARFRPDLVHITGPSDVGMMGAVIAHKLQIPLVASWHTNLHEYAATRAASRLRLLPGNLRRHLTDGIESASLRLLTRFYRIPRVLFAPNPGLVAMLQRLTGKPCFLMTSGVDIDLFNPLQRDRTARPFTLGYVGRITVEKNIDWLVKLEAALCEAGQRNFRFLIVGQGAQELWLRQNLRHAEFAGVLHGEELARAYANMDLFVFPSETDSFGNVVLEALASGVPTVVTNGGGPKFTLGQSGAGAIANDQQDFIRQVGGLIRNRERLAEMSRAARIHAHRFSWDAIFDSMYDVHRHMITRELPLSIDREEIRSEPVFAEQ